ncbi:MAG: hypothetical protein U9R75_05380, partial [Candidatus Thermoplasmatota archaeon]|nr:hypothetical protein [Candidatus Thermoplasmatota archaeon]
MVLRGIGFCPGHITGFFSIHDGAKEIMRKGSRGAGVNLTLGALSNLVLTPSDDENSKEPLSLKLSVKGLTEFTSDPRIYGSVLEQLLPNRARGWEAKLRVNLQLPVGQGFGMSGAGALATAVAVWESLYMNVPPWDRKLRFKAQQESFFAMDTGKFKIKPMKRRLTSRIDLYSGSHTHKMDPVKSSGKASGMLEEGGEVRKASRWLEESRAEDDMGLIGYNDLVAAAHKADILTKGGLGDVVAQARGGIEMRLAPGIPPFGEVHTVPVNIDAPPQVAFLIVGEEVETASVLDNPSKRGRINEAGETALKGLMEEPTPIQMLQESSQFSRLAKLQSMEVRGALTEVQDFAKASQVMVGNSVFAFVGGTLGSEQREMVVNTWRRRGDVKVCDIDLMG